MADTTYDILISKGAEQDLKEMRAFDRSKVFEAMDEHLPHEPTKESRSGIKKLTQPAISQYRLRVGDYRVYYDVEEDEHFVSVIQVYEKGRSITPKKGEGGT
jgi:mRNA-degrading endonuclease RelE of RelBE toxin-antitoxin system